MFAHAEPVVVQTPGTITDPYSGDDVSSWDSPAERPELAGVADGGSTEPLQDARNAIESDFDLIFDHDPGVTTQDRVVVRTLVCEVVGRPFLWRSPFTGWEPGTVVRVKIREG